MGACGWSPLVPMFRAILNASLWPHPSLGSNPNGIMGFSIWRGEGKRLSPLGLGLPLTHLHPGCTHWCCHASMMPLCPSTLGIPAWSFASSQDAIQQEGMHDLTRYYRLNNIVIRSLEIRRGKTSQCCAQCTGCDGRNGV